MNVSVFSPMENSEDTARKIVAAVARCTELEDQIKAAHEGEKEAKLLHQRLAAQRMYDKQVQLIISAHPDLASEWHTLEDIFLKITGTPLLRTGDEKIAGRRAELCTGCERLA